MEPFRAAADRAVLRWLSEMDASTELTPDAKRFLVRETLGASFSVGGRSETPVCAAEHASVSLREALLSGDATRFAPPLLVSDEVRSCG